jgi:5-methylcytosine-specific restriction endonuclease McrA
MLPLSPDRYKIAFTASQRVRDMLEEARELRRHRDPAGGLEALFEHALELLIADEKKRRFGQTAKPRQLRQPGKAASPKPHSRYIPHEVRRHVWRRDGGQCCFCGPDGIRCAARSRLQFHHQIPFERGGPTSTDNLELMCASHNALLAERDFGRSFIVHVRRARSHSRAPHARDPGRDSERARDPGRSELTSRTASLQP